MNFKGQDDIASSATHQQVATARVAIELSLAEEDAYLKGLKREQAERERKRTKAIVKRMADQATSEQRANALKAEAAEVHAKIQEIAADANLRSVAERVSSSGTVAPSKELASARIDDLPTLLQLRELLPAWLTERLETIHAKVNWRTQEGKPGYFNNAVHKKHIPIDKALTVLAHMHGIVDGTGSPLDRRVDAVIECGLFKHLQIGRNRVEKSRCHDSEHCEFCKYFEMSNGLLTLLNAYDEAAFYRGGHFFAFTVAPRTNRLQAKAVGRTLNEQDWNTENPDSAVFRESHQPRVFEYRPPDCDEYLDWEVESTIRSFLGAAQSTFKQVTDDGWLDGFRGKIENSIEFLPFKSHQHWHGVGSSRLHSDPQQLANYLKEEIDRILLRTDSGVYADVLVAVIPTPEDLQRWLTYITKTVDLAGGIEAVYNRHPHLARQDPRFLELRSELNLYLQRSRRVFGMVRYEPDNERNRNRKRLTRHYAVGSHRFGKGSILTESEAHRIFREEKAEQARRSRRKMGRKKSKRQRNEAPYILEEAGA